MEEGKLKIYACGGTGINIAYPFQDHESAECSADIEVVYIDASKSNLKPNIRDEQVHVIEADGSGKVRRSNYNEFKDQVKPMLLKHKPADFNIVVFSGSGGSGSVVGPLILSEMIARKQRVVALVVGSDESKKAADNTLDTLKTLEGIANKHKQPVIMHYRHNQRGKPRSTIDTELRCMVSYLAIVASRQIEEIDGEDITNFLYYTSVTSVDPRLAVIEAYTQDGCIPEEAAPHTMLNIYQDEDQPRIDYIPEYHVDGHTKIPFEYVTNLHFYIDVNLVQHYVKGLQKVLDELKDIQESRVKHVSIVNPGEMDDDGFVIN